MKRLLPLSFATGLVAALGLTACTPKKEDAPPSPKVSTNSPASTEAKSMIASPAMGALPRMGRAPKWEMKDLEGKSVTSESLKGKVVVVDFWATWCPPCRAEIPGYVELQKKYGKDGLVIVGASLDQGGPEVVKPFAQKFGINYQMVMADDAIVSAFGGVEAIPTTFLIDRAGEIRDRKVGAEETADYERKIAAVLGEKA